MINVVMPECDGVAVGRHVLEQWPEQRILYMSAHPAEVVARHRMAALEGAFLAEPYTRGEVLAKVKQALEQQPQGKRVLTIHEEYGIETMVEHA
jgi:DNA-binding NtrC family response regulator